MGPSRQTQIDVVHRQTHIRFGTIQTDTGRRGALVSRKQIETLQADTDRRGALASTETNLGPSRQTWCISEHKTNWDPSDRHTDKVH